MDSIFSAPSEDAITTISSRRRFTENKHIIDHGGVKVPLLGLPGEDMDDVVPQFPVLVPGAPSTGTLNPSLQDHLCVAKVVYEWMRSHPRLSGMTDFMITTFILQIERGMMYITPLRKSQDIEVYCQFFRGEIGISDQHPLYPNFSSYNHLLNHKIQHKCNPDVCTTSPAWHLASFFDPYYRGMWMSGHCSPDDYHLFTSMHQNNTLEDFVHEIMSQLHTLVANCYRSMGYVYNGYFGFYREGHPLFTSWQGTLPITKENIELLYPSILTHPHKHEPHLHRSTFTSNHRAKGWKRKALRDAILQHTNGQSPTYIDEHKREIIYPGFDQRYPYDPTLDTDITQYKEMVKAHNTLVSLNLIHDCLRDFIDEYGDSHPSLIPKLTHHVPGRCAYYACILHNLLSDV
jgi:hypothetical protein